MHIGRTRRTFSLPTAVAVAAVTMAVALAASQVPDEVSADGAAGDTTQASADGTDSLIERSPQTEHLFDPNDNRSDGLIILGSSTSGGGSIATLESEAFAEWEWSGALAIPEYDNIGRWAFQEFDAPVGIPAGMAVTRVSVHHEITHTYIGDLQVRIHNAETSHGWMVRDREGGSADDVNETRTEENIFDGDNVAQRWFYGVRDLVRYDVGTVTRIQLYVYYGLAPEPGEIRGTKWNDLNGDGTKDANEPGLAGWNIYLDVNRNGRWDLGEPNVLTDSQGGYTFTDLKAATYVVTEVQQPGWTRTFPASPADAGGAQGGALPVPQITTTGSHARVFPAVCRITYGEAGIVPQTEESGPLINMDGFRSDSRFAGIDGTGCAVAILDTGIDLDHPFFGPDDNDDGVADRIVYQYDFYDNDNDASDENGHGSNVSTIVASEDVTFTGMAPGASIIHLKVLGPDGGEFYMLEAALQWLVANASAYNVVAVNMSLGDGGNYSDPTTLPVLGINDEMAALRAMGVIVVSASGNEFYTYGSQYGASYPAADPSSLSIGAVYDANLNSGIAYGSGAIAYSTDADRICPFSQRSPTMTTVFAPGAEIVGADPDPNYFINYMHGTSQAAPHIAGIAALAQQLAEIKLGRRLTSTEFTDLVQSTGVTIYDGDDEDDNVQHSWPWRAYPRVDMLALANAIQNMVDLSGTHTVTVEPGQAVTDVNFGNHTGVPITNTLTVTASPEINTPIDVEPDPDEETPFTRSIDEGVTVALTAPASHDGLDFVRWRLDGASQPGLQRTLTVLMDDDHSAVAVYIDPNGVFHPADRAVTDWEIGLSEVTAYGAAWRGGDTWATEPNPIPMNYVTRCGYLWRQGEVYYYDDANTPPLCWKSGTAGGTSAGKLVGMNKSSAELTAGQITARRTIEPDGSQTDALVVRITVVPSDGINVYAVQETPPPGRNATDVSDGGTVDATAGVIRWGPFFGSQPRTLTYRLTSSAETMSDAVFAGKVSGDGASQDVVGEMSSKTVEKPFTWTCGPIAGLSGLAIYVCVGLMGMLMMRHRRRRRRPRAQAACDED